MVCENEDALNNQHMQFNFILFSIKIECAWKPTNLKSKLMNNLQSKRGKKGVA